MVDAKVIGVVARSRNGVIGKDGGIPWRVKGDLAEVKELTMGHYVIMGRKTWESLPKSKLPGRLCIVISSKAGNVEPSGRWAPSVEMALDIVRHKNAKAGEHRKAFIFGGESIYREAMRLDAVDEWRITEIPLDADGDTFFPELGSEWRASHQRHTPKYDVWTYTK